MPGSVTRTEKDDRSVILEATCGGTRVTATVSGGQAHAFLRGGKGKAEELLRESLRAAGLDAYGGRQGAALYIGPTRMDQTPGDIERGVTQAMEAVAACARRKPIRLRY